jgi:hypothetical protein
VIYPLRDEHLRRPLTEALSHAGHRLTDHQFTDTGAQTRSG